MLVPGPVLCCALLYVLVPGPVLCCALLYVSVPGPLLCCALLYVSVPGPVFYCVLLYVLVPGPLAAVVKLDVRSEPLDWYAVDFHYFYWLRFVLNNLKLSPAAIVPFSSKTWSFVIRVIVCFLFFMPTTVLMTTFSFLYKHVRRDCFHSILTSFYYW